MKPLSSRTLDTVTPGEWRAASKAERDKFIVAWARKGLVSFCCLGCGFPTAHGQAECEACRPIKP